MILQDSRRRDDSLRPPYRLCEDPRMAVFRALMWVLLPVFALASAACVAPDVKRATEPSAAPSVPVNRLVSVPSPPEWRRGDRWTYEVTSGTDRGTKTMEVVERLGDLDHYYTIPSGTDVRAH